MAVGPLVLRDSKKMIVAVSVNRYRDGKNRAKKARQKPLMFLDLDDIFGDLSKHPVFTRCFSEALKSIWSNGIEKTLEDYILS